MDIAPSRKFEVLLQNAEPDAISSTWPGTAPISRASPASRAARAGAGRVRADLRRGALGDARDPGADGGADRPAAELERLAKRQRKAEADLDKLQTKLANGDFAQECAAGGGRQGSPRLAELRTEIDQLAAQIARVKALRDR